MRAIGLLISLVALIFYMTRLVPMMHADDDATAKYDEQVAACEQTGHKDCDQIKLELSPFGKAIQSGIECAFGPDQ